MMVMFGTPPGPFLSCGVTVVMFDILKIYIFLLPYSCQNISKIIIFNITPVLSVRGAPVWILMSLLNLAHSSQFKGSWREQGASVRGRLTPPWRISPVVVLVGVSPTG